MRHFVLLSLLCLAACESQAPDLSFGGAPLISGKSPPAPYSLNSEPEPVNSLPRGAMGVGNSGPNATFPNYGAISAHL